MSDAVLPKLVREQLEELERANRSALEHHESFAGHRERLTALVRGAAKGGGSERLCVLGAGNCYDLDLGALAADYAEIHLVDLDAGALERARSRQPPEVAARITCHAPIDLSGMLERLEAYRRFEVTPEELMRLPQTASRRIAASVPGPFDVVVSACLLTQLQLSLLGVLGERHRLFLALREVQNLVHLRSLARLIAPGGRALLVSDVASDQTTPRERLETSPDVLGLLHELVREKNVIYVANPELLAFTAREDPWLEQGYRLSAPREAWLWHNGPARVFLVYAVELAAALPGGA